MSKQVRKKLVQQAASAAKRQQALSLRIAGASYQEIATALGVSIKAAWQHVQTELDRVHKATAETAEKVREMELDRLDKIQTALWGKRGESKTADTLLRVQERRSRYLGLDVSGKQDAQEVTIEIKVSGPPGMLEAEGITVPYIIPLVPPKE